MSEKPSGWAAFWQTVFRFEKEKLNPWMALRNAIGIFLPLAAGVAFGNVSAGVAAATGALNVAFSDSTDPYRRRAFRMLSATVLVSAAVFAGAISARDNISAIAVATIWAFVAGLLVAISTNAADLGTISLVTLVVFAAQPLTPENAVYSALLAMGGGLLQTVLSLLFWPVRRYEPERRALSALYAELSRGALTQPGPASEAPTASAASTHAQQALAVLNRDHKVEAERYRMLLSQAERMRLGLLVLWRIRTRLERQAPNCPELSAIDDGFAVTGELLGSLSQLLSSTPASPNPELLNRYPELSERLRRGCHDLAREARFQMDALAGQVRAAIDLAAATTPKGQENYGAREKAQPVQLRLSSIVATLAANLTLKSTAFRHAVRLAFCIAIGDAVARGFDLRRSYWLPMTIAIVLKPDFTATFSRGVLRLLGTFTGLVIFTILFHVLHPSITAILVLMALVAYALRWIGPANYGVLVVAITGYVVLLFSMLGVAPKETIEARGWNTLIGGLLSLAVYWAWPTWERTQVREMVARQLDAYRLYFREIRKSYEQQTEAANSQQLDAARLEGRLARSNLEASVDRLLAEPRVPHETISTLGAILASSHRLAHAMMSLEAGLSRSQPVPPRAAFITLADHFELTMYYLAAGLRGSPLTLNHLPDLREDHHALVASGDPLAERYALVNIETDRMTNSLNTLSEEIVRWVLVSL